MRKRLEVLQAEGDWTQARRTILNELVDGSYPGRVAPLHGAERTHVGLFVTAGRDGDGRGPTTRSPYRDDRADAIEHGWREVRRLARDAGFSSVAGQPGIRRLASEWTSRPEIEDADVTGSR